MSPSTSGLATKPSTRSSTPPECTSSSWQRRDRGEGIARRFFVVLRRTGTRWDRGVGSRRAVRESPLGNRVRAPRNPPSGHHALEHPFESMWQPIEADRPKPFDVGPCPRQTDVGAGAAGGKRLDCDLVADALDKDDGLRGGHLSHGPCRCLCRRRLTVHITVQQSAGELTAPAVVHRVAPNGAHCPSRAIDRSATAASEFGHFVDSGGSAHMKHDGAPIS